MNCHWLLRSTIVSVCFVLCAGVLAGLSARSAAAQTDLVRDLLTRINAARVARGLPPYALSDKLTAAAQAHSKYMASTGKVDRTGADGSTPKSRILAAGYGQWSIGPVIDEAIYGGTGGAQGAFDWWMSTETDRNRLFSTRFREVGIGAASAPNGWIYWTLDLGAQPNVLPAFVNNGAASVDSIVVTLTLTSEGAVPAGEGTNTIGQPVQVRVASDDSFTGTDWQPWAAQVQFRLLPKAQQKVYVLYRDAQGRTAPYSISVTLTNVPPTPTSTPTLPPSITPLPTNTLSPTPTSLPTRTPVPTSTGLAASPTMAVALVLSPLPTVAGTPQPTAPRPTPRLRITPTLAPSGPYGAVSRGLPIALCGLQSVALVLGALLIVRRSLNRMS